MVKSGKVRIQFKNVLGIVAKFRLWVNEFILSSQKKEKIINSNI